MTEPPAEEAPRVCVACGVHLERREHPLPAHAMLGTWWDHPPLPTPGFVGHTVTHLDPSPDLRAQLVEQARRSAGHVHPPLPVTLERRDTSMVDVDYSDPLTDPRIMWDAPITLDVRPTRARKADPA